MISRTLHFLEKTREPVPREEIICRKCVSARWRHWRLRNNNEKAVDCYCMTFHTITWSIGQSQEFLLCDSYNGGEGE